jgi:hypothetical protein
MPSKQKRRPTDGPQASLTNSGSDTEPPSWHYDALRQMIQRYEKGQEQPVYWPTAKCKLRKLADHAK